MRLPWPFGRTTPSDGPSSDPAGGPGGDAADAPVAQRVAADAPPTGAWAALPPIQRTVGAPPLVAPTAPFLDAVPGNHPLPPIVQPLGHEVAPSAPAGLVAAHVAPVPSLTSHAAMPTRHVQRRTTGPSAAPVEAWPEPEATATPVEAPSAPVEAPSAPVRHVAPVAASQTVTPAVRPLTVAPPVAPARTPVAQRTAAPSATSAAGSSATPASGSSGTASSPELPLATRGTPPARAGGRWSETPTPPVSGLGAPIASASGGTGSPSTASSSASAAPTTPAVQRSTDPGTPPSRSAPAEPGRRSGLGAPMTTLPPTAAPAALPGMPLVQRSVSAEAIARAIGAAGSGSVPSGPVGIPLLGGGAPAGASPAAAHDTHVGHDHASSDAPSAAGASGSSTPVRPLPVLPVARQRATAAPAAAVQRSAASGTPASAPAGSSPARPGAAPPAPAILPLLGSRPLRPSVVLQRHEDTGTAEPGEPDVPVVARWASGEAMPDAVRGAGPGAAPVPLQRLASADAPAAPVTQPEASPAPVREMLFATAGWSPAGLPPGVQVTTQGSRAAMPVAPAVQRAVPARDGQALQLARPAPAAAAVSASSPSDRRVETGATTAPSTPAPTVQTSPAATAAPMLTATPIVQRVEGASPPVQEGGSAGQSDTELDELSRKLFGRIRGQLRAEIIHEREARGLSFDSF